MARVLFRPPTRKDGEAARAALERVGIEIVICADFAQMIDAMRDDAGALLLTELALLEPGFERVVAALEQQPRWSDLPVVLMLRDESPLLRATVTSLTNVTLLDRPCSIRTLISTIETAIRARQRQYQIRDQLVELEQAESLLRTADKRKDEFLATLAHELRNPLAPIRTAAYLLAKKTLTSEQTVKSAEMIMRQTHTMTRLLEDLLDVARVTSGKMLLRLVDVTVASVLESALEASRPVIESKRHRLNVEVSNPEQRIHCDPVRLAQVLTNVLTNAAKYTDPGGAIDVRVAPTEGFIEFVVRDNGIGIDDRLLSRLFDMFVQADGVLDRAQGGLGIGLALSKSLVEMHGGRLVAESAGKDRGSAFRISIPDRPALDDVGVTGPGHVDASSAPMAGFNILIVDDNRDAADAMAMALRLMSHHVEEAFDGEQALEEAALHHPCAMLVDIGMPGINGYEVARRIREEAWGADVLLVACTGWGQPDDKRKAIVAGFDVHMTKPIVPEQLAELLKSRLPRRAPWTPTSINPAVIA